jgi:hypothetical protein
MNDRNPHDGSHGGHENADVRLGRHALALLQAARDAGDQELIIQAEAMAMAVGFALASRLPNDSDGDD